MKFFLSVAPENWICDRLAREWSENSSITNDPSQADIVWILSPYIWRSIPTNILRTKPICLTIHHVTPWKFTRQSLREFMERDKFIDLYHVPCEKTKLFIEKITKKPIFVQAFWVNQNIWKDLNKEETREQLNISKDLFLVGSFQRDTEGHDLKSPKLEKGPDIFCDIVENLYKSNKNMKVILAGLRRQYVKQRLEKAGIEYLYYELVDFETLNKLYNVLDLYIVSSRCEGGPQAIVEAAITKTPIVSTEVGIASLILSDESIYRDVDDFFDSNANVQFAFEQVQKLLMPIGFEKFRKEFANVNKI